MIYSDATVFLPVPAMPAGDDGDQIWPGRKIPRVSARLDTPGPARVTNLANPYKSKDEPTHYFLLETWLPFFSCGFTQCFME